VHSSAVLRQDLSRLDAVTVVGERQRLGQLRTGCPGHRDLEFETGGVGDLDVALPGDDENEK